ncbi:hypothetical protein Scep_022513 [Stephania cephalantha]|uniref:Uncharacterized protein n=1 Tax=Stephania cephalantha TaxID=152367 RepID=A0AAP0FHU4_9MAGN
MAGDAEAGEAERDGQQHRQQRRHRDGGNAGNDGAATGQISSECGVLQQRDAGEGRRWRPASGGASDRRAAARCRPVGCAISSKSRRRDGDDVYFTKLSCDLNDLK